MGKLTIIARATTMLAAVAVLVGGVTFASIQSTATLDDSTIATATANLEIGTATTGVCNNDFGTQVQGFDFAGIVPGAATGSQGEEFCLRNVGAEATNLSVMLTTPELPTYTDSNNAPVVVNNSMVNVELACTGTTGSFGAGDTLQTIWFNGKDQGTLAAGETAVCTASVNMEADAFTADSVKSTNFDLVFTGTGV